MTLFPKGKKHLQKFRVCPAALKKMFRVTTGNYAPNCRSQNHSAEEEPGSVGAQLQCEEQCQEGGEGRNGGTK